MEIGLFIQTPVFEHHRKGDPDYEHQQIMQDLEVAIAADKAGFKYVARLGAPLPRRVLAPVGERRGASGTWPTPPSGSTCCRGS